MKLRPFWLLLAGAVLLLWDLNYAPFWNPDEGRYASASLEMAAPFPGEEPSWIVPQLNSIPRLNKPPLVYWPTAIFFKIFGPSEGAGRLTSALAAVGVMLVLWQFARRAFGERTGVLAALVWATCALPFVLGHLLNTDMLLTFSIALSVYGLWEFAQRARGSTLSPAVAIAATGVGLGLAMLAKGPVGVVLAVGIWGAWLLWTRRQKLFSGLPIGGLLGALALAALISAPWYIAIAREHPEFLAGFLFGENIARLTGAQFYHNPQPRWFYLPVLIIGVFPWTAFLVPAFINARAPRSASTPDDKEVEVKHHARLLLWFWAALVTLLFSISHVKLITYVLPAFPALAVLVADAITFRRSERVFRGAVVASGVLFVIMALALPIAFFREGGLTEKLAPYSEIGAHIWLLSALWIAMALGLFFVKKRVAAIITVGTGVLFVVLLHGAGKVSPYEDASGIIKALRPHLKSGDEFVQFKTFQPTAIFYLQRPVMIVDFVNTSGLEEDEFKNSGLFPLEHEVIARRVEKANRENRRIFVLGKWKHIHWPTLPRLHQIAANNDYRLLSNQPAPDGFSYEFLAPRMHNRELSPECKALSPEC